MSWCDIIPKPLYLMRCIISRLEATRVLSVLLTLAVVSILGTVVEQNKTAGEYVTAYGEGWTNFIMALRINDLFHSWWFIGLLGALSLNIIVCTFERFPPKWKSLLNHKPEKFDAKLIDRFSTKQNFTIDQSAPAAAVRSASEVCGHPGAGHGPRGGAHYGIEHRTGRLRRIFASAHEGDKGQGQQVFPSQEMNMDKDGDKSKYLYFKSKRDKKM